MNCLVCGTVLVEKGGRRAKFCSARCKQRDYRDRKRAEVRFPKRMTGVDRWVRAEGKVPYQTNGWKASSTRPSTWSSYADVVASDVGDGMGIMMGDGLAVYDLDHVFYRGKLKKWAAEYIAGIEYPIVFAEVSKSGEGVHVFVEAPEQRGSNKGGVEFYSMERFVRVTGNRLAGICPVDVA